jgi:type II secretory pathway predicted ATPase ExeA
MARKATREITPVVRFWKLTRNPFLDTPLSGSRLSLFSCRDEEIADLLDGLDSPLIGVYGSLGVGKTSFLNKAADVLRKDHYLVVYADLGHCSHENLYCELLRILLMESKKRTFKLKSGVVAVDKELSRLGAKVTSTRTSTVGARAILKGEITEGQSTETSRHTEESAQELVRLILESVQSRLVVLMDDIERIKYVLDDQDAGYLRSVAGFTTAFKDLSNNLVSLVITLDDHFAKLVEDERKKGDGAFSYSFGEFIELPNFSPQELTKALSVRLKDAGWTAGLEGFIDDEAFWLLAAATAGHPRKVFNVLRQAMRFVSRQKRQRVVDREALVHGLNKTRNPIDDTNAAIISYLRDTGGASPSNDAFHKAVGLKRNALLDRLKALQPRIALEVNKVSPKSGKQEYSLPRLVKE